VAGAAAGRLFVAVFGVVGGEAHPLGERLEEGDLDGRALAGPLAPQQRGKDARVGVHARRYVGDGDARFGRRLGRARDGDEAGLALDEQVVGLFVPVRARGAVAGDVAHDEPGVAFSQ
jgi:hypothetical protein